MKKKRAGSRRCPDAVHNLFSFFINRPLSWKSCGIGPLHGGDCFCLSTFGKKQVVTEHPSSLITTIFPLPVLPLVSHGACLNSSPSIGHTWSIFPIPVLLLVIHRECNVQPTAKLQCRITYPSYDHLWSTFMSPSVGPATEYMPVPRPPIGQPQRIFPIPILLLVTLEAYLDLSMSEASFSTVLMM
jgi:hypothetical protein